MGDPSLVLSKPILITKQSNPWLISNYLVERIKLTCNSFYLEDQLFSKENDIQTGPRVLVRYREINLFWK